MAKRKYSGSYGSRKKSRTSSKKKMTGKSLKKAAKNKRSVFARSVMRVVNNQAEQKELFVNVVSNQEIWHNHVQNLYDNVFKMAQGVNDDQIMTSQSSTALSRIGGKIYVKGIKVAMNLESQQYRPSVKYTLFLIRKKVLPQTAITTKDDMYEGTSTTIPCDYIDKQKCHILFAKSFYPKMPNMGTSLAMKQSADGSSENGFAYTTQTAITGTENYQIVTNPQIQKKFYVPINKHIQYQDGHEGGGSAQIPIDPLRYQWVIVAYDNFTTHTGPPTLAGATGWPVGHITLSQKLIYTDV